MTAQPYDRLEDVIRDEVFPEVDLALRAGRHIDQEELDRYTFLGDALHHLEPFYRRFGFELIRATDGYFFLAPASDRLARRQLTPAEMLAGQALALLYLDPITVQAAGRVPRAQLLELLDNLVGNENLIFAVNPRRRRRDEKIDGELVRKELDRALKGLARLGFIDLVGGEGEGEDVQIRLRTPLLRFADPVRDLGDPAEALSRLVAGGQAALVDLEREGYTADERDPDPDPEPDEDEL